MEFILCRRNSNLGVWLSVDPLLDKYPGVSPYNYCMNNPLNAVDPDGRATKPLKTGGANFRTALFVLNHPAAAASIGLQSETGNNISSMSRRFATRTSFSDRDVNASRHIQWQANITKMWGATIAKEVGFAHEDNPSVDLSKRVFTGEKAAVEADQTVDLLNNEIGRQIGEQFKSATAKQIALITLSSMYTEGAYEAVSNEDGSIEVKKIKITQEQFEKSLDEINKLKEDGSK